MGIHENLNEFHGKPVRDFKQAGDIRDFSGIAPRVRCEYEDQYTLADYVDMLLDEPGSDAISALVLGMWCENGEAMDVTPQETIEYLVANRTRLPNLQALFVGDIISEENEISWISQGDMSSLWAAFPALKEFGARGGNQLRLGKINHNALARLVVQTGGMPAPLLREALETNAPLQHLELWLGTDEYGGNTSLADLQSLVAGQLFPGLKYLGLCNSDYSDDIAAALAGSAILDRIETLDLSNGTLTDKGAQALLDSGQLAGLKSLDITFHYVGEDMVAKLAAATPNLIARDPQKPDEWDGEPHYYVAVSE